MRGPDLIDHARSWLGVPFRHQGRTRHGVDCIGLPIAVLRSLEMLPAGFREERGYGRLPDGRMLPIVEGYCSRLARPEPGCLVLVQWPNYGSPSHAGLFTGRTLIHAYQKAGGVVEHGFRGPWRLYCHSSWRLPGIG